MLHAGCHKLCISPPVGAPLTGFSARQGVAQGVHDDLFARALVLANGTTAVALVSVEVLALSGEFVARVRARTAARTGVAPHAILVACTHTHAGPVTIKTFFNPEETLDAGYMDRLAGAIEETVATAWQQRFPARIGWGTTRAPGIAVNRRSPDGLPVDDEVGILKVEDSSRHTRAVCVNFACHPTVLGPDNLLVTGDFPATALAEIEAATGALAMFFNGTQGDISMGHSSELSAIGVIAPGRTFEHAAELGHRLADASLAALPQIETQPEAPLAAATTTVELPLKPYPPVKETVRALREADVRLTRLAAQNAPAEAVMGAKTERLYAEITYANARDTAGLSGRLPLELQALRVNDAALLGVPAEVFVGIGLRLKRTAPQKTLIAGLANGYIGYLPARDAYAADGYEVVSARCAPDSEDILVAKALDLEKQLWLNESASA